MQSGMLVGLIMIVLGGLSVGGFGAQHPPTPVGWAIAGALVVGGGLLFLRRPFAWWIAVAAAIVTVVSGMVAQLGRPQWGLPMPPLLSVVVGLYVILRLLVARSWFYRKPNTPAETQ
jgi:hypothetical protein